ncbi:MAG: hypothetical protein AUJ92_01920 [Armatimonadetes bacterium CG2_30_59_28]|nr:hypothetical protein [Armatimonadota bacterium]OIO98196.1 MAG: hypothetical protein AUJ92_01920 [Armatimonadetes bacterium CG2_30_59_28]PIU64165.1 MAG: hypothetical protein COS85_13605 [Armatimonadetes bacterium CG07_land_8_20_14_0_80_59_28]
MPTVTYPNSLFFDALMREIAAAESTIQVMSFIFRSDYVGTTRAKEVLQALTEAQARGAATALHKVSNEVSIALMP